VEKERLEKLKDKSEALLQKYRLNSKTMDMLNEIFSVLELYKLEIFDLLQLPRIVDGFKKLGWDTSTIIDKYKSEQDLALEIKKQETKMKKHEAVLEDLYRKRMEEERKWGAYFSGIQVFNKLVEAGLKPQDIFNVSYILQNNYSTETISCLLEDIDKYGSVSAATARLERNNTNMNVGQSNYIDSLQQI